MKDSYYCSERTIRKNHAHGYDTGPNGLVLKALHRSQLAVAAGSLCSNTMDLVAWNKALHGGKVLKPESYKEMTSPGVLTMAQGSGTEWASGSRTPTAAAPSRHGGGINGFLSESEYYPTTIS